MLTAAVLSAICTFGGYSVNLSNYPRFYDNLITLHCYYDLNKGYYEGSTFDVLHFHDIAQVRCDIEKQDDGYHVFVNDMSIKTYLVNNATNDSESLIGQSVVANYSNSLSSNGVLLLPNDDYRYLRLSHSNWQSSSSNISFQTFFTWYDDTIDDGANVYDTASFTCSTVSSTFRANTYDVDLTGLYNVVNSRFGSADGGYEEGYNTGYGVGFNEGSTTGYDNGYADGYAEGVQTDDTAFAIFNGILTIGMIPINALLTMLDFSVFGINISNFVMSLLTVLITLWVVRMITGGGNKSD